MSNKEYAIIFDCDGTVLDTYQLIIETVYQTFAKMLPNYPLTYEEADAFFGPLLADTFSKYAKDKKQLNELIECYRVISNNLMEKYIKATEKEIIKEVVLYKDKVIEKAKEIAGEKEVA